MSDNETYGRIKKVGKTAVMTTFAALMRIPILPERSYYFVRTEVKLGLFIPFLFREERLVIHGYPLAKIDRLSVVMAFVRAGLSIVAIVSFLGTIFSVVAYRPGMRFDERFAMIAAMLLVVSIVGAAATFLVPTVGPRERAIRLRCGELLGCEADPAYIAPDMVLQIRGQFAQSAPVTFVVSEASDAIQTAAPAPVARPRAELLRELILARCRIAVGTDRQQDEAATDDLLAQLARPEDADRPK